MKKYYFLFSRDENIICDVSFKSTKYGVRIGNRKLCMEEAAKYLNKPLQELWNERNVFIKACVSKKRRNMEVARTKQVFRKFH